MVDLGCFAAELVGDSAALKECWGAVFKPFLCDRVDNSIPVELHVVEDFRQSQAVLFLDAYGEYLGKRPFFTHPLSQFAVYAAGDNAFLLVFQNAAIVHVSVTGTGLVRGVVHEQGVANGRFEDILYTALAPILRRRRIYLVHSFAAEKNGRCVLIVGPPGSGKTTAGLSLLQAGWQLLSNDVTLLTQSDKDVVAWPTPGYFGIRPHTIEMLPDLEIKSGVAEMHQVLEALNGRFGTPTLITHLIFPQVNAHAETKLTPLAAAAGWSRLMSESMDCWDKETLAAHLAVLKAVCGKTAVFSLQSGINIDQLDRLLAMEA
ncbi:MAG: hypothetical protein DWQ04_03930 [Chloroflexi bacterium]|nr:MAG: hypothetical protein DWQ04_03930 [Chloroflexota bacterium]